MKSVCVEAVDIMSPQTQIEAATAAAAAMCIRQHQIQTTNEHINQQIDPYLIVLLPALCEELVDLRLQLGDLVVQSRDRLLLALNDILLREPVADRQVDREISIRIWMRSVMSWALPMLANEVTATYTAVKNVTRHCIDSVPSPRSKWNVHNIRAEQSLHYRLHLLFLFQARLVGVLQQAENEKLHQLGVAGFYKCLGEQ